MVRETEGDRRGGGETKGERRGVGETEGGRRDGRREIVTGGTI